MLVLSRQRDEVIVLIMEDGREIELTVVDIRGDKTRLGIEAPKDIMVHRKEVWQAIKRERCAGQQIKIEDVAALKNSQPTPPKKT